MAHTLLTMDEISNSNEYWIGDTGATTHITGIPEGIYNCASPEGTSKVAIGNGSTLEGWIVDETGSSTERIELGSVTVSSGEKIQFSQFNSTDETWMEIEWK